MTVWKQVITKTIDCSKNVLYIWLLYVSECRYMWHFYNYIIVSTEMNRTDEIFHRSTLWKLHIELIILHCFLLDTSLHTNGWDSLVNITENLTVRSTMIIWLRRIECESKKHLNVCINAYSQSTLGQLVQGLRRAARTLCVQILSCS